MNYLPLFHNLHGRMAVLIGGGDVALRKARLLADAGAVLRVVAPDITGELAVLAAAAGECRQRSYQAGDLAGAALVVAATNQPELNRLVYAEATARGLPVNVVDTPALCSVIFPAIVDRSPLLIAVSSGGDAPVLARLVRARLEAWIPAAYGQLAGLARHFRARVKAALPDFRQRRIFWEEVFQGEIAERVFSGQNGAARQLLEAKLSGRPGQAAAGGEVYLVGAGPGDPDLLTFRALRLMQQADVVLYDRLVAPAILALCRRDVDRLYVGKRRAEHALPQAQINQQLVSLARQGKRVLRLKGGDPFIFGRGGEEIESLAAEGIPFQVVPGITAASGCAAYAGIPLTHRDYAQSVRFITGHLKDGSCDLPWQELSSPGQTLVFYMGLVGLPLICQQLMAHGRAAETPAALIEQGTTPRQRVFAGTLADLPARVQHHEVHAPTLLIIGEVVRLRAQLAWFEGQPVA